MNKKTLAVGDVIQLHEGKCIVWLVNHSRAACNPISNRNVHHKIDSDGVQRFTATAGQINISPNSECQILRRVGERGLMNWIDGGDPMQIKDQSATTATIDNSMALIQRHPLKTLVMAMGAQGWSKDKAGKTLLSHGIDAPFLKMVKWLELGVENKDDIEHIDLSELTQTKPRKIKIQN